MLTQLEKQLPTKHLLKKRHLDEHLVHKLAAWQRVQVLFQIHRQELKHQEQLAILQQNFF